jgi:hypothetical protein
LWIDLCRRLRSNCVLQAQQIGNLSIVAVGPDDIVARMKIQQSDDDAYSVAAALKRRIQHVVGVRNLRSCLTLCCTYAAGDPAESRDGNRQFFSQARHQASWGAAAQHS